MISIVTSIFNQLSVNKLYYESLMRCTSNPFELIIIDNNSNDGSREYFEARENVKVINTGANYNYPYCQNLGIKHSKYDLICFFNNDIIVTMHWDERMIDVLKNESIQVLSFSSNDHLEDKKVKKKVSLKWKSIKYPLQFLFGNTYLSLKMMVRLMYFNVDRYSEKRYQKWKYDTIEGYSGSAIAMKRGILSEIGLWDERIQTADFDLFNRLKLYSQESQNVLPLQLALGIYIHHFQRLTIKKAYPPFENISEMIPLAEKWGTQTERLRKDIIG